MPRTETGLYQRIYDFNNLDNATHHLEENKRYNPDFRKWMDRYEENIIELQDELIYKEFVPGPLHNFVVFEPKKRNISDECVKDKIIQNALIQQIEPVIERRFVYQSFACRKGKGTLAACRYVQHLMRGEIDRRGYSWVIFIDFHHFFPDMDISIPRKLYGRSISCKPTLDLIGSFLDAYREYGLPLGLRTSQLSGNCVGDAIDHYLANRIGNGRFVRYMDDMRIYCGSKQQAVDILGDLNDFSTLSLHLRMNDKKTKIRKIDRYYGDTFCSYRIYVDRFEPKRRTLVRTYRRLRKFISEERENKLPHKRVMESYQSFLGYMKWCRWNGYADRINEMVANDGIAVSKAGGETNEY